MARFNVERVQGYTIMSNYHLRDNRLSMKAKGLMSVMLSLPPEWDYSLRGLAAISRESVNTIGSMVKELEECGYIERYQERDASGKLGGALHRHLLESEYPHRFAHRGHIFIGIPPFAPVVPSHEYGVHDAHWEHRSGRYGDIGHLHIGMLISAVKAFVGGYPV